MKNYVFKAHAVMWNIVEKVFSVSLLNNRHYYNSATRQMLKYYLWMSIGIVAIGTQIKHSDNGL